MPAEQLPDTTAAANELVKRPMFDPEVAKHLLNRPVEEIATPVWNKKLARVPAGWNHPAEKDSRQINMLEHVLIAKPLHTLAGHALNRLMGWAEAGRASGRDQEAE